MPELPEVETVRRGLEKYVVGHRIVEIEIVTAGIFQGEKKSIEGAKIIAAKRIGKGLILTLDNDSSLAIHIKMTGQLIYRDESLKNTPVSFQKVGTIPNKFTHVIFHLDKGGVLYYNDQRRFGWIRVINTKEVMDMPFFKNMGPEPFKDLTLEKFTLLLSKAQTKIKPFIMDQTKIGGIGNIYANDALWNAKIDPKRPAKSLNDTETKELFNSIIKVMEKSFEQGGASELSFVNILGQEGNYQNHSLVYGKTGKQCPRHDGGTIKRISLGGRGTFYCEVCQK
jgi:formamidopyrimidine-DNA glycosylase